MKKMIAVLLVVLMALSLVACSGKSGNAIVGTWELTDGEGEQAKASVQMMLAMGMTMSMTFHEDGTGKMDVTLYGETQSTEFTYTYENGVLKAEAKETETTQAGAIPNVKIDGDKLIMEQDGMALVFKKK